MAGIRNTGACLAALLLCTSAQGVSAQVAVEPALPPAPAASAEATVAPAPPSYAIPSPEGLVLPKLDFTATPEIEADFEKYFYFHRAGTSFAEAYADLRECDALASGSSLPNISSVSLRSTCAAS